MSTTAEVLKAARAKIAKPEAWTKGAYARDSAGRRTRVSDPAAVCWCSMGTIIAETTGPAIRPPFALLEECVGRDIGDFNDDPTTTHADVLAMFDKAIALAEQEQS